MIGVPDDEWGQRVMAFVVPESESKTVPPDELELSLRAHCELLLGKFKCPRTYEFRDGSHIQPLASCFVVNCATRTGFEPAVTSWLRAIRMARMN